MMEEEYNPPPGQNPAPLGGAESANAPEVVVDVRNLGLFYARQRRISLLKRFYGRPSDNRFWALRNLSFQCQKGDILGVIGRNGAGKSTLSLVLSRIYEPDEGVVQIQGDVSALLSLGGMFQPTMSGRDNAYYFGAFLGLFRERMDQLIEGIKDFSELGEFFDEPVGSYSSGMRSRLAFSIASSIEPEILILDEVLSVGDFGFRKKCEDRLQQMMARSRCIIIISHSMGTIQRLCNKVLWIEAGHDVAIGTPDEIIPRYRAALKDRREYHQVIQ